MTKPRVQGTQKREQALIAMSDATQTKLNNDSTHAAYYIHLYCMQYMVLVKA